MSHLPNDSLRALAGAFVLAAPLLVGCGNNEAVNPVTTPAPTADAGDTTPDAGTVGPKVVRTIELRDPFGNTAQSINLLADGDFELTGRQGQMPWYAFAADAQATLAYEMGGTCRSGVRCARLDATQSLLGFVVSPKAGEMSVSLWAKPLSGKCKDIDVILVDGESQVNGATIVSDAAPDASGWCHFQGSSPNVSGGAPELIIQMGQKVTTSVIIDDAVILPAGAAGMTTQSLRVIAPDLRARAQFLHDWIRRHRRSGLHRETVDIDNPPKAPALTR